MAAQLLVRIFSSENAAPDDEPLEDQVGYRIQKGLVSSQCFFDVLAAAVALRYVLRDQWGSPTFIRDNSQILSFFVPLILLEFVIGFGTHLDCLWLVVVNVLKNCAYVVTCIVVISLDWSALPVYLGIIIFPYAIKLNIKHYGDLKKVLEERARLRMLNID